MLLLVGLTGTLTEQEQHNSSRGLLASVHPRARLRRDDALVGIRMFRMQTPPSVK
jgi:hypothetical protein